MITVSCFGSSRQIRNPSVIRRCSGQQLSRRSGRRYIDAVAQQSQTVVSSDTQASRAKTLIKICGVTSAEDAQLVAAAGADFIGMIMWPKAKRSVAPPVAQAIAAVARQHGAKSVGVFVDEDARTIEDRCQKAGIGVAQLHGDVAREALASLPHTLQVIYVMHADSNGVIQTPRPAQLAASLGQDLSRPVEWVLVDGIVGGSGEKFDWGNLAPPKQIAEHGWFLAGGLGPHNVAEAVQQLRPTGVDVSSGVTGPDKLSKDPEKVHAFVSSVQSAIDDAS